MLLSRAPPHRAALSSLLPTRLNHRLRPLQLTESKIDNKVSGMKNWWPVVHTDAAQLQVGGEKSAENTGWAGNYERRGHIGAHVKSIDSHTSLMKVKSIKKGQITWNIHFPFKGKLSFLSIFNHSELVLSGN